MDTSGQTKVPLFPKIVISTKTPQHKNIPGTNVFIIPPNGFTLIDKESTFRFQDTIFIHATTMPGINFYQNSKTFTKEKFIKKGKTVIEFSEIKINNLQAKISLIKEGSDNIYQIMTGTSSFTTMILASYPSKNEAIGKFIRKSLETIYCDKAPKIDPFYTSFYRLDDSKSTFKLARSNGSDYLFSKGGILKTSYDNEPYLIVTSIPVFLGANAKNIADEEYSSLAIDQDSTIFDSTKYINSNQTYERVAFGKLNDKRTLIFQYSIMLNPKVVLVQGFANKDYENNLTEFRKLSKTIKQQD